jgi:hypothetical protein
MSSDCGFCDPCAIIKINTVNLEHNNWALNENERVVVPVTIDNLGFLWNTTYMISYILVEKGKDPIQGGAGKSVGQQIFKNVPAIDLTDSIINLNVFGAKFTNSLTEQVDLYISCYPLGMDGVAGKGEVKFVHTLTVNGTNGFVKLKSMSVPKNVIKDNTFSIDVTIAPTAPVDDARLVIKLENYTTITRGDEAGTPLLKISDMSGDVAKELRVGDEYAVQLGRIAGTVTKRYRCVIPDGGFLFNHNKDREGYFRLRFKVGTYVTGDSSLFEHDASDIYSIRMVERGAMKTRLTITSMPTGANVVVMSKTDGSSQTVQTPAEIDVSPGEYILTATRSGYTAEPLTVIITDADTKKTIPIMMTKVEPEPVVQECRFVNGAMTFWAKQRDGSYRDTGKSCSGIPTCVEVPGLASLGCVPMPIAAVGAVMVFLILKELAG